MAMAKTCIDLDQIFGDRFQIRNETGAKQKPKQADPWMREIRCRRGSIYPMGGKLLAATIVCQKSRSGLLNLLRVPGVRPHQVGDMEGTVIFDLNSPAQAEVFKIMKPYTRRKGGKGNPSALETFRRSRLTT